MKKIALAVCAAVCAVGVSVVQAGQFRALKVTAQKTYGSVTAFDLEIGPSAGPDATSISVPVSRLPEWGTATCKAVRFLFLPGDMYVPLQSFRNNSGMIEADYTMTSRDEARC